MKITIRERYRPFSHAYGISCLIPGTSWVVVSFPTRFYLRSLEEFGKEHLVSMNLTGPIREFTTEQDLEKGCVFIWGRAQEGAFRLRLERKSSEELQVVIEKAPSTGISSNHGMLEKKASLLFSCPSSFFGFSPKERLSLGCNRAQEWESIYCRYDLAEILPLVFQLGQFVPPTSKICEKTLQTMEVFLRTFFGGMLVPRIKDEEYQGLTSSYEVNVSPLEILAQARDLIRRFFFEEKDGCLCLKVPHEFHSGRLVNLCLNDLGTLDMEWSNGRLRRAVLRATKDGTCSFDFAKKQASFRFRTSLSGKGERLEEGCIHSIRSGTTYYLDKFQK